MLHICGTLQDESRCTSWSRVGANVGPALAPELKIDTEAPDFAQLAFAPAGDTVWAATTDNKLERYCCATGALLTIVDAGHQDEISALLVHPSGDVLFTGGHDRLLKTWDIGRCVIQVESRECVAVIARGAASKGQCPA